MRFIINVLATALAALLGAYILPNVSIADFTTALIVALVLAFLNAFIRPVLVLLTIPVTIVTLGLFLLVINIIIIKIAAYLVDGFSVEGWLSALLFSFIISIVASVLGKTMAPKDRRVRRY